jgi:hypothetical protein
VYKECKKGRNNEERSKKNRVNFVEIDCGKDL